MKHWLAGMAAVAAAAALMSFPAAAFAKTDAAKLRSSYKELLEEYGEIHPDDTEFALTDMDGDGVNELIFSFTADDGEFQFDFFTGTDSEADWLGSYVKYADLYVPKDGRGIYAVVDRSGKRTVDLLTLRRKNGETDLRREKGVMTGSSSKEFTSGYQVELHNVNLFLEGGEKMTVLSDSSYVISGSDSRYIDFSDIAGMNADTLRKARNEIYARRGRRFKDKSLQKYFESKSWYRGIYDPADFNEKVFNKYEKANISFISGVEKGRIKPNANVKFEDDWFETYYDYTLAKTASGPKTQFEIYDEGNMLEIVFGDGETFTFHTLCDTEGSDGSYGYDTEEGATVVYWPGKQHAIQLVGSDRDGYYYPNTGN